MKKNSKNYEISKVRVWAFVGAVIFGGFIYLQVIYYLIPEASEFFLREINSFTPYEIQYMWIPIISYLLISIEVSLVTMMISGRKLKEMGNPFKQGELFGLIDSLVEGLIFGLIIGLIIGLIEDGLTKGLTLGLIVGLTSGLIGGLISEFTQPSKN